MAPVTKKDSFDEKLSEETVLKNFSEDSDSAETLKNIKINEQKIKAKGKSEGSFKKTKTIYTLSDSEKETLLYSKSTLKTKTRKKARLHSLKVFTIEGLKKPKVLIRNLNIDCLKDSTPTAYAYQRLSQLLPKKVFIFDIRGGGFASQVQLAIKNLYLFAVPTTKTQEALKDQIKRLYPTIDRTDARISLSQKYGGQGARARSQKSYR